MRLLASLAVACFVALSQPVSFAQQTSPGSARGTVVDPAGSPVPGATLELLRGATVIAKTVSDGNGAWTFEKLAPGEYQIRVTLAGFATTVVSLRIEGVKVLLQSFFARFTCVNCTFF